MGPPPYMQSVDQNIVMRHIPVLGVKSENCGCHDNLHPEFIKPCWKCSLSMICLL